MQNPEASRAPAARPLVIQRGIPIANLTAQVQGLIYPRQENAPQNQNILSKYPPLIIEDETKNYVDGIIDDDDSDGEPDSKRSCESLEDKHKKTRGRVKIKMEFIQNKLRRYTTFSKRKTGIMKKAYELSTLTGTQVMLLVASETGHVYTFATRKLQPMITSESGKALIQTCLNSPDPSPLLSQFAPKENPSDQRMSQTGYEEPDLQYSAADDDVKPQTTESVPAGLSGMSFTQGGQGITTYISTTSPQEDQQTQTQPTMVKTSSSQPASLHAVQQGGSVAAIIAPTGSVAGGGAQTIQVHPQTVQPQILQGQLHMHKIHPQNILLSGNMSSLPSGHIIVNPNQVGSQVVIANSSQLQNSSSIPVSASHSNENIIIVPNGGTELPAGAIQMVYNTPNGLVYASPASVIHSHSHGSSVSGSDTLTIHQPVVQSSYQIQQDSGQQSTTTAVLQTT